MRRAVEPAVIRCFQWRGDPVACWMGPRGKADPYPLYERSGGAPSPASSLGAWVTAGHATASAVLRDRRFSSHPVHQRGYRPPLTRRATRAPGCPPTTCSPWTRPTTRGCGGWCPARSRPRRSLRSSPSSATPRPGCSATAGAAGFDLIEALAFPLPIAVICHLLGVPAGDRASFRAWGHDVAASLEPQPAGPRQPVTRVTEVALAGYLRDLVERRRAEPDDSLLSALVAAEEEGDRLTPGELVSTALLLLVAGFETTVNLIGNGTVALLSEPAAGAVAPLAEDPGLVAGAVEELLRYDSPVQMTSRNATEDVERRRHRDHRRGTPVIVAIGGANRDPAVFDQPAGSGRPAGRRAAPVVLPRHPPLPRRRPRAARGPHRALRSSPAGYPASRAGREPVRRPLLVLRGFEAVPVRQPGRPLRCPAPRFTAA